MIRRLPHLSALPAAAPMPEPLAAEAPQGGLSMSQVMNILLAHWKLSATITTVCILLAAVVIKFLPKVYEATATLIVNYENKDPLAGRTSPADAINTYIPTQMELMTSPVVLLPVVDQLKLTSNPQYVAGFKGDPAALRDYVERNLASALNVFQGTGSQLIYVNASAKYSYLAAQIANAVTDEYLKQERQRTNAPAGERAARYSAQLAELREKVTDAQDAVAKFRQRNGLTDVSATTTGNADIELQALTDLETKLLDAQNQRRAIEAREAGSAATSDAALTSPRIQALKAQLQTQQDQLTQLQATLGPRHPRIIELKSQISATNASIAAEVRALSQNTSTDLSQARALEARYQQAVDAQRKKLLAVRDVQGDGAKLLLELESAQATYKRALDGYDQIMFASTGNYTDVSYISRATPPVKSTKPNKIKLLLAATAAALLAGLAIPFAYELLLDRRVRSRDDLERDFGIPVLAEFDRISTVAGAA